MYHFSKRIKCLDCGKNYKGKKERKDRIVLICSGYSNYGKEFCSVRWKLDQSLLLSLIYDHFEIELIKSGVVDGTRKKIEKPQIALDELLDRVDGIEVSPKNKTLRIQFKDGTSTLITPNQHSLYVE